MLETIAIILLVLWAVGLVSSYTMGGMIHILLVIAVVVVLLRVIQGRRLQNPSRFAHEKACTPFKVQAFFVGVISVVAGCRSRPLPRGGPRASR